MNKRRDCRGLDSNFEKISCIYDDERRLVRRSILLTRIASISLSETGVRFGKRDAFPPTAVLLGGAGTSELNLDLAMKLSMTPPSLRVACVSEIEPIQQHNLKSGFKYKMAT